MNNMRRAAMKITLTGFLSVILFVIFIVSCQKKRLFTHNAEYEVVEQTIHNVIGWALEKDFDLFFNTIANDSNFISVTPYDRVKFGVDDVKNDTAFWASPNFKAVGHEIHDLRINFSKSGEVAWYYCVLDDYNTWQDQPANWEKVRWTGVLEKRNGRWRVVQQHYSWPK